MRLQRVVVNMSLLRAAMRKRCCLGFLICARFCSSHQAALDPVTSKLPAHNWELRAFTSSSLRGRHLDFCIPDLALSANTSSFVGDSPLQLPLSCTAHPLHCPLLFLFFPERLRVWCMKGVWRAVFPKMLFSQHSQLLASSSRFCWCSFWCCHLFGVAPHLYPSPVPCPDSLPATPLSADEHIPAALSSLQGISAGPATSKWCCGMGSALAWQTSGYLCFFSISGPQLHTPHLSLSLWTIRPGTASEAVSLLVAAAFGLKQHLDRALK